jgi:hypothetical protein
MDVAGWLADGDPPRSSGGARWRTRTRASSTSPLDDGPGPPSRRNTLRALRVLRWHAGAK